MVLSIILATLSGTSLAIGIWQLIVALRFPLRRPPVLDSLPVQGISILKPLKGCDAQTAACLTSWLRQSINGPIEILFGVSSDDDPVCELVRKLVADHPVVPAQIVICGEHPGVNPKVAKLARLARQARHAILCVSDADVFAEPGFLVEAMEAMRKPATGLVNALYRFAPGETFATRLEALAVNADFWSQVLQALSLGPPRFALGAAMLVSRSKLIEIGGFESLAAYLADDYELGRRIAESGASVQIAGDVVECRSAPTNARGVWNHQLRWARTICACRPWSYFFSIHANATLWPVLWFALRPDVVSALGLVGCLCFRAWAAFQMEARFTGRSHLSSLWMILVKDLLQAVLWSSAFLGQTVVWRDVVYRIQAGGKVAPLNERIRGAAVESTSSTA